MSHSRPNAVGMVGEAAPSETFTCAHCGIVKSEKGDLCQACQRRATATKREQRAQERRLETRRERQPRFEAALAAGWTLEELCPKRRWVEGKGCKDPLPTWDEIAERAPKVVIKWWWAMSDNERSKT